MSSEPTTKPVPGATPEAQIGYKSDGKGGFIVRVCAYGCAGKAEAEKLAKDGGFKVSHGMCEKHYHAELVKMGLDTP